MNAWLDLGIAIVAEVAASTALPATQGFRNLAPSIVVVVGYGAAFYFLSRALETIPLGVSYAIWSGVGLVLISLGGWIFYRQALSLTEAFGVFLIIAGVVVLKVAGGR
jgi:small multidrug resistance pump